MLNELKAYKNLDVYETGRNSKALSSDIATELKGRATQIHVYPLPLGEFYSFVGGEWPSGLSGLTGQLTDERFQHCQCAHQHET